MSSKFDDFLQEHTVIQEMIDAEQQSGMKAKEFDTSKRISN